MPRAFEPELVPVLPNHRFDEGALLRYLDSHLAGFEGPCRVQQFQGGQSNPTFHLAAASGNYVLRKRPGGTLVQSAHAVDREYRIMAALGGTGVPVPKALLYCADAAVIGTDFFVMAHLPGRIITDPLIKGVAVAERDAIYRDLARTLARLHAVDPARVGLGDYGRVGDYIPRQLARWSRQYAETNLPQVPEMDEFLGWLRERVPAIRDETTIAHGDYRLGNVIIHPTEPRVIGILDWELSTLGHPLADLAYCCLPWYLPPDLNGLADEDAATIPSQAQFVADYCEQAGRDAIPDFTFFVVFSLYRWAAIVAGVYRRALDGNASDPRAIGSGERFKHIVKTATGLIRAA
ncbi:phosphotransferase [Rhodopseudomonas palustris]|uniref:Phosphotransferase family protein n=1 Tax=Rhodopseudomonas palustris TaxID=1076 RepID=A0A418V1J6_RHOPL|nr:phosphotransferase [Rhodopseudomonas palustris]RJF69764.1 phosphotransferase family protein [Rhodopseudomonas palustris]